MLEAGLCLPFFYEQWKEDNISKKKTYPVYGVEGCSALGWLSSHLNEICVRVY